MTCSGFLPEALLGFLNPNLPHHLELYRPKPWGLIIATPITCVTSPHLLIRLTCSS